MLKLGIFCKQWSLHKGGNTSCGEFVTFGFVNQATSIQIFFSLN